MKPAEWLPQVLAANGMAEQDLEATLKLQPGTVRELMMENRAQGPVWNAVLSWFNSLPALSYPAADILPRIDSCIREAGEDARCLVYYGVSASDLIFTGLRVEDTDAYYGSDTESPALSVLHLTLQEARTLFFKQNCTLQSDPD